MPTQKQILASIDERLGAILAAVKPVAAPVPLPPPDPAPSPPPVVGVPPPAVHTIAVYDDLAAGRLQRSIQGGGGDDHVILIHDSSDWWKGLRTADGGAELQETHASGYLLAMHGVETYQLRSVSGIAGPVLRVADLPLEAWTDPTPQPAPQPAATPDRDPPPAGAYTNARLLDALPAPKRPASDLLASRRVLPFDKAQLRGAAPLRRYAYNGGKYTNQIGLTPYMGTTGERQEIGESTDAVAEWLMGTSDENNMLVQAEAHGDVPVYVLDGDGRFLSIANRPAAGFYSARENDPFVDLGASGSAVSPEGAHYPCLNFVPFLATDDPFHLAALQAAANFMVLASPASVRGWAAGWLRDDQVRGWAWAVNLIAKAWLATPEGDVPKPLLPKSYWRMLLDANRNRFLALWVADGAQDAARACHLAVHYTDWPIAPWQHDYLSVVLGWMIWTGEFPDWRPIYDWQIQFALDRALARGGFPRSQSTGYWWNGTGVTDMASLAAANGLAETPDGDYPADHTVGYAGFLRAALKLAALNEVPDAALAFAYADRQAQYIPAKYAF